MVIKFFLIYIGVFLGGSIAFVLLAKNFAQGLAVNAKKPVIQGSLSAVGASILAYLSTLFSDHLFLVFWGFAAIFLVFGIIHVSYFHRKYFYANSQDKSKVALGEIMFMLAFLFFIIVVFSSLQYFLKNKDFLFLPMLMSMLAFFIPLAVYYTFEAAYKIPAGRYPYWQYPLAHPIELPDEKPNEKLVVIAFMICKKTSDNSKTNFRAKGPETMKLGDLYYHFINDYNEFQSETPIQYADNGMVSHEWAFRMKPKWYQPNRILDPELTVRENRINENSIIICERM